jgi:hypothetical protein
MKKLLAILIFCAFAFAQNKPPCSDPFIGKGIGKGEKEAIKEANEIIAIKVKSSVKIESSITRSQREIDGVPEDTAWAFEKVKMAAELENAGDIRDITPLTKLKNGQYEIERYLCPSNAAKPFLKSLMHLNDKLAISAKKKTDTVSCKAITETYYSIKDLEGFLENLGQMNLAIKKEYELVYAKAKEECGRVGKGVYIESDNKELKKKVGFLFTKDGCVIAENKDEAAIILSMNYEEREKKNSKPNLFTCEIRVEISLRNIRTGKSPYENIVPSTGVELKSFENACEDAMKPLPSKIWEEIKEGKFNKGECK